jgi:predicted dinucleotide-binding enzyme
MLRRALVATLILFATAAHAETVAVIGTGNVGMAIGTEFAGLGHTVVYGSRSPLSLKTMDLVTKTGDGASAALPIEAAAKADVVVLAVPGMVTEVVARELGDLGGKIIIDATNPLARDGDGPVLQFRHGVASSNGEIVQSLHPDALVVKAFNTIPWQQMIDPGKPTPVMPLAGNDAAAKTRVAEWVQAMGIDTVDVGGIVYAGVTERLIVMTLNNQFSDRPKFDVVFRRKN